MGEARLVPVAQSQAMPSFLVMAEHVLVDESAAENIFAGQAQPVFSRMVASEANKMGCQLVGHGPHLEYRSPSEYKEKNVQRTYDLHEQNNVLQKKRIIIRCFFFV